MGCISFPILHSPLQLEISLLKGVDRIVLVSSSHIRDSIKATDLGLLIIDNFQYSFELTSKQNEEVRISYSYECSCYNMWSIFSSFSERRMLYIHCHRLVYRLGTSAVWFDSLLLFLPPPFRRLKAICFMTWTRPSQWLHGSSRRIVISSIHLLVFPVSNFFFTMWSWFRTWVNCWLSIMLQTVDTKQPWVCGTLFSSTSRRLWW